MSSSEGEWDRGDGEDEFEEAEEEEQDESEESDEEDNDDDEVKVLKPISKEELDEFKLREERKGVIYVSRIPPHMKPQKIRHMMSQYGEVGRVFLTPEDEKARRRRIAKGGNKKKNFTDGWIEFLDKRMAKRVALSLNNTPMGGSRRNYFHDDIWNMKYLSGFKWHHLTERIAYQNAVRDSKLRAEVAQATREKEIYLGRVQKVKVDQKIADRKAKKRAADSGVSAPAAHSQERSAAHRAKQLPLTDDAPMPQSKKTKKHTQQAGGPQDRDPSAAQAVDLPSKKMNKAKAEAESSTDGAGRPAADPRPPAAAITTPDAASRPRVIPQKRPISEQEPRPAAPVLPASILSKLFSGGGSAATKR